MHARVCEARRGEGASEKGRLGKREGEWEVRTCHLIMKVDSKEERGRWRGREKEFQWNV